MHPGNRCLSAGDGRGRAVRPSSTASPRKPADGRDHLAADVGRRTILRRKQGFGRGYCTRQPRKHVAEPHWHSLAPASAMEALAGAYWRPPAYPYAKALPRRTVASSRACWRRKPLETLAAGADCSMPRGTPLMPRTAGRSASGSTRCRRGRPATRPARCHRRPPSVTKAAPT